MLFTLVNPATELVFGLVALAVGLVLLRVDERRRPLPVLPALRKQSSLRDFGQVFCLGGAALMMPGVAGLMLIWTSGVDVAPFQRDLLRVLVVAVLVLFAVAVLGAATRSAKRRRRA